METPDFTRFAEAHRAYAESLFAKIRSLSASPAPNRGVTRFGYSEVEDRVLDALEEEGRALGLDALLGAPGVSLRALEPLEDEQARAVEVAPVEHLDTLGA